MKHPKIPLFLNSRTSRLGVDEVNDIGDKRDDDNGEWREEAGDAIFEIGKTLLNGGRGSNVLFKNFKPELRKKLVRERRTHFAHQALYLQPEENGQ